MKVLIPVDGSEPSLYTLQAASRFLNPATAEISLFTVKVPVAAEVPWALMQDAESAGRILADARTKAEAAGLNVVRAEQSTFHEPASAICQYADEIDADLILMGSHGYQGLAKFLMGSVSERVFKQAAQPVIIVRNDPKHTAAVSHLDATGLHPTNPS